MVTLNFGQTAGERGLQLGPFPSFRVEGELLRSLPDGEVLARHVDHSWEVNGSTYFRLDVAGPVRVHFDKGDEARSFGPYRHYSMADGIAYVDRLFFASLSAASGQWHCIELPEDWPGFSVVSAAL